MFKKTRIITAVIIILFTGILSYLDAFGAIEGYYEDMMYQRRAPVPSDIKIIAIDDTALEKLGPYSNWNRSGFAKLIDLLYSGDKEPKIVGIDVEFTGKGDKEGDELLVRAAEGRKVVLASKLNITTRSNLASNTYEYYVSSETTPFEALSNPSRRRARGRHVRPRSRRRRRSASRSMPWPCSSGNLSIRSSTRSTSSTSARSAG